VERAVKFDRTVVNSRMAMYRNWYRLVMKLRILYCGESSAS
jgi:hypothetical protein